MFVFLVTKGIVSLHGGTISVHSDGEGCGSTFTVELPILNTPGTPSSASYRSNATTSIYESVNDELNTPVHILRSKSRESSPTTYNTLSQRFSRSLKAAVASSEESILCSSSSESYQSSRACVDGSVAGKLQLSSSSAVDTDTYEIGDKKLRYNLPQKKSSKLKEPRKEAYALNDEPRHEISQEINPFVDNDEMAVADYPLTSAGTAKANRASMRVLVVDDATSNRKMVSRSLRDTYGEVDEAVDGVDAVSKVRLSMETQRPYDLILMDFFMPNMDGPTAVKIIKEELGFRGTVVGLTGNALPSEINTFLSHGAERVLIKPVNISVLRNIVL